MDIVSFGEIPCKTSACERCARLRTMSGLMSDWYSENRIDLRMKDKSRCMWMYRGVLLEYKISGAWFGVKSRFFWGDVYGQEGMCRSISIMFAVLETLEYCYRRFRHTKSMIPMQDRTKFAPQRQIHLHVNYSRDFFLRNPRATINFEHVFNARTCFMSYFWVRHYF